MVIKQILFNVHKHLSNDKLLFEVLDQSMDCKNVPKCLIPFTEEQSILVFIYLKNIHSLFNQGNWD